MNEETHRKCIKDANRKFASLARSIYTSDIFDGAINILKCIYVSNQFFDTYVMFCTIWYHLHNLKNVKKTHGGMLLLVKLQVILHVSHFLNCAIDTKSRNTSCM